LISKHGEEVTRIGVKFIGKGNKELVARGGGRRGGEAGNTGAGGVSGWCRGCTNTPPASASCSEEDGNVHVMVRKTMQGPMYEIGERLRSWMLIQLTLMEDPGTEELP